ncbi:unnamed protein product [Lathyrus sativus]|nr:unnamed protein product [Lathyrus sativus]
MRKWLFNIRQGDKKFKLELSYKNIRKIELHQPRGKTVKYLLLQLIRARRVFELYVPPPTSGADDPLYNYCKEFPDDQWIRTIDFTPERCIGQSTILCLELPSNQDLPDFRKNFTH